ncbi:hypothetical protein [Rhodomicrobium lacus]|uniref:hypothetical protein n=1 Tax=Rhodomicrobium lacus TaxID=2498452 RepID=UPI0026E46282|nr:hypothetical protein [Rhodomicrobium lacus]WKW50808.1 hypothetical protein QMO75_16330 [Rhodomicrobium lacus]
MLLTSEWIRLVQKGDFTAIPKPFVWNDSIEFAHLINGYAAASEIGIDLPDFANMKASAARATGSWDGTATELWLCLFYEHRRARHSGEPEECGEGANHLDPLCATLRSKLQDIGAQERGLLLALLAGSPRG